jgi:hypothetical protein
LYSRPLAASPATEIAANLEKIVHVSQ